MERIERLGIASRPPSTRLRNLALEALGSIVFGVFFPALHRRARWVARAGPVGVAMWIVARAAFNFGADAVMRWMARHSREMNALREQLADELGREPTEQEI